MTHTFLLKDARGPEPERLITCRAMRMCFWMIPLAIVIGERELRQFFYYHYVEPIVLFLLVADNIISGVF